MNPITTPQTHPEHDVVGHHFAGHSYNSGRTEIYLCDSYDPSIGYWLTNIANPRDRKNVSGRAFGRTFHEAHPREDHWWVQQWNITIPNVEINRRLQQCLSQAHT